MADMKIKVTHNGPYEVSGNVPLDEKIIRQDGYGYRWEDGRSFPDAGDVYYLCRCGHSSNAPFCDGSHREVNFDGAETAAKASYSMRSTTFTGPVIDLLDDERCAFARFCHSEDLKGNPSEAWQLATHAQTDAEVELAQRVVDQCPAGRLTAKRHDGELVEPELEPGITVMQDPAKGVSGGLYVHGGIDLEDADGKLYERRNRYSLCRCGESMEKPFCDAFHVPMKYNDGFALEDTDEDDLS